jgi:hypothetical protein
MSLWVASLAADRSSVDDIPDDFHACGSRYIGYDMVKLQVHLHESFLHVLDMSCCIFD